MSNINPYIWHITYHIMCLLKVIKRVHLYMQVCAVFSNVSPQQLLHPELDIHEAGLAERLQQRVHRGRVPRQPDQSELSIIVSDPPITAHLTHSSRIWQSTDLLT